MVLTQQRSGRLLRIRPGVYLEARRWPEDPSAQVLLRAEAEAAVHPGAVLSHDTAALVWGLPALPLRSWVEAGPVLTLPPGSHLRTRPAAGVRIVVSRLPAHQQTSSPEGIPVTSLARTAIDVAAGQPLPKMLVVLDAAARALCAEMVSAPRRRHFADRRLTAAAVAQLDEATRRRRGCLGVRLALPIVDPCRESPIESLTAGHLHLSGLPMPEFQAPVRTPVGVLYPDCLWAEQRLIGESDGATKYNDPAAIVQEKEREQVLRDLDFTMVRWLGKEIVLRPEVVIDRIARALGA